jgi:hypothetical protein
MRAGYARNSQRCCRTICRVGRWKRQRRLLTGSPPSRLCRFDATTLACSGAREVGRTLRLRRLSLPTEARAAECRFHGWSADSGRKDGGPTTAFARPELAGSRPVYSEPAKRSSPQASATTPLRMDQPVRIESVTTPLGIKCYDFAQNGPREGWLLRLDSNQQPSG